MGSIEMLSDSKHNVNLNMQGVDRLDCIVANGIRKDD